MGSSRIASHVNSQPTPALLDISTCHEEWDSNVAMVNPRGSRKVHTSGPFKRRVGNRLRDPANIAVALKTISSVA